MPLHRNRRRPCLWSRYNLGVHAFFRLTSYGLLLVAVLFATSCATTLPSDGDAGTDARPLPATRILRFLTPGPLRIEPGTRIRIDAELRDAAMRPAAGTLRFALVGDVRDGSLDPLMTNTVDGVASTTLRAPSDGASLRVRASAEGAPDAYLDVSVSARGFGGISVSARYTGVRGPERLEILLFDGIECDATNRAEPIREVPPLPSSGGAVDFAGLSAGRRFAVRANAVGRGGVLATDCVGGITVVRNETAYVPLRPLDLPLRVEGAYTLGLRLDLSAAAAGSSEAWSAAAGAEADTRGGQVRYVLALIADAIEARSGAIARAEFERSVDEHLRADLEAELTRRGAMPLSALARLAGDASATVRGADASALVIAVPAAAGASTLRVATLTYALDPLTPDVAADDFTLPVATGTELGEAMVLAGDRVAFRLRGLPMPFAALARRSVEALLSRIGVVSTGEYVRLVLDCASIERIVRGTTAECDAACVVGACQRAADQLGAAFDRAVATVGAAHATVDVGFEGAAQGRAGELVIEAIEAAPVFGTYREDSTIGVGGVATLMAM